MELWLTFLWKFNLSISLIYLFYIGFLRRLTFHHGTRFYFLSCLSLSLCISCFDFSPLFTKAGFISASILINVPNGLTAQLISYEIPGAVWDALNILSLIAMGIMVIRLAIQFHSILKITKQSHLADGEHGRFKIYYLQPEIAPFSFINRIYLNPTRYSKSALDDILLHEGYHIRQLHFIDVLYAELILLLCSFNPFAWLLKKEIILNLEYATDAAAVKVYGRDRETYQLNLLNVNNITEEVELVNHFSAVQLKERLFRLNSSRSHAINMVRYFFIAPLLLIMLTAFNFPPAPANEPGAINLPRVNDEPGSSGVDRSFQVNSRITQSAKTIYKRVQSERTSYHKETRVQTVKSYSYSTK